MPKTKISEYSATANSNTDVASINIDEGCAPSGINNAIRAVMGHLKDFQAGTNSDSFNGPTNGAHNGSVGATTPAAGSFTTLSASGNVTLGDASTDTLNVGNGGIVKDASGNVGIGTSSPASKLNVVDAGTGANTLLVQSGQTGTTPRSNTILRLQTTATGRDVNIQFSDNVTNAAEVGMVGGNMYFATAGAERARIDSSGNVGIGTSSPSKKLEVGSLGVFRMQTGSTAFDVTPTAGAVDTLVWNTSNSGSAFAWNTNSTERMRIDSSGNLMVGTTSANQTLTVAGGASVYGIRIRTGSSGSWGSNNFNINWTGSAAQLYIDNSNVGTITLTSDYRVKRNIATQEQTALDRIAKLRPVTYQRADYGTVFQADEIVREGFIAHELQSVIPSAVEGEKDSENQIQSLKLDALCSVLVKAIQEQQALITQLQADVAALKGN